MKYLFFVAWVRTREKNIADRTDLDRIIGASTMEEALRVLNDTDYAPFLLGKNHFQLEEIMIAERKDLRMTLERMGFGGDALDFLFLKEDLILLGGKIKRNLSEPTISDDKLIKKHPALFRKIKQCSLSTPEKIDDLLMRFYFEKAIRFCAKSGETEAGRIFKKYWRAVQKANPEQLVARDGFLSDMEEEIIYKSREAVSGIMPILAFLIKKRRAEYFIKIVFAGKRIGLDEAKIVSALGKTITI